LCYGFDLSTKEVVRPNLINLEYLFKTYTELNEPAKFFLENNFIDKLYGSDYLRKAVVIGLTPDEIRASWQEDLDAYKTIRMKYLIY